MLCHPKLRVLRKEVKRPRFTPEEKITISGFSPKNILTDVRPPIKKVKGEID